MRGGVRCRGDLHAIAEPAARPRRSRAAAWAACPRGTEIMILSAKLARWWRKTWARLGPRRRLRIIDGDSLPPCLPRRDIVLARDDGEDWCVGMRCPRSEEHTSELQSLMRISYAVFCLKK